MADDFATYEPHTLTEEVRDRYRDLIDEMRADAQWASMLESALDDADYWRSQAAKPAADDSELQGEVDLLRQRLTEEVRQREVSIQMFRTIDRICESHGIDANQDTDVCVRNLADALRDELAAAKRKQQQDAAMIQGQSLTIQRLTEENERLVAAANHRAIEGEVAP